MSTVVVTRMVDAELTRVWALLTDLPRRITWLSTIDRVEVVTDGGFCPGAVWRESHKMADGTRVTEEYHVCGSEPPRRFVVSSPGIGADYRVTYTLAAVEMSRHRRGTLVTVEQEGRPSSATGKMLELVFGALAVRTAEGALRQELDDLARAVQTDGADEMPAA